MLVIIKPRYKKYPVSRGATSYIFRTLSLPLKNSICQATSLVNVRFFKMKYSWNDGTTDLQIWEHFCFFHVAHLIYGMIKERNCHLPRPSFIRLREAEQLALHFCLTFTRFFKSSHCLFYWFMKGCRSGFILLEN